MKPHDALNATDVHEAQWEATRGAAIGAAKWGAASAILGATAYAFSPIYRGLTIQFKVTGSVCSGRSPGTGPMREAFEREFAEDEGGPPPPPRPRHLREAEAELQGK
ncbi:hypothetical protein PG994_002916 [Apiospora phragmitis]|uniref:Uncharacterized protein n=1 Tax=Apiospora phragmitis TaxID=2905665 RepID=A0ABR1W6J8_9PEZI